MSNLIPLESLWNTTSLRDCRKTGFLEADGKCPYVDLPKPGTRPQGGESKRSADKSRGMRRTEKYAAATRDEGNAADGRFPKASKALYPVLLTT